MCRTCLTLKAPITIAPDDIHNFFYCFSEKIKLDVSSESSARQRIHMKNQALFSLKGKCKKIKMLYAAIFVWVKVKIAIRPVPCTPPKI